ncbi:ataxin-7-like isoform X1 [Scleropages formosus]|uniref:Ataxin 7 n=1 Tax=Scleropages formosus TaxID=113540 RepID=A0A8C9SG87_SCLFO|nr:ataxin-7-like isoform X1 [Scleropages formosus]
MCGSSIPPVSAVSFLKPHALSLLLAVSDLKHRYMYVEAIAGGMSERADGDGRAEQRRAARQHKHHQQHHDHHHHQQHNQQQQQQQQPPQLGEGSAAMAALPSPQTVLGQSWSDWINAAQLQDQHGAESEESLKECDKNWESMRLSRDDMAIFGQCPAQDDFYLVMCSQCSQVVKPQAFLGHYERRHSSSSKPPSASIPSATYPLSTLPSRNKPVGGGSLGGTGRLPGASGSSSNSKVPKVAKEKLPVHNRPPMSFKVLPDRIVSPGVKVEKPVRACEAAPKPVHTPSSSTTVSSKPSLTCSSIPKAPLLSPGQIPNGKTLLSSLDRKQDDSASYKRHKRISEREFNADFHCGVLDLVTRKPCTRSLTCKTHSLSQRRAVPGRRKRFDALLAEHKSRAREKELQRTSDHPQQPPPLRDPQPPPSRFSHDLHQGAHGNAPYEAKPSPPGKPRPHNPSLPRLNSHSSHSSGNAQGDLTTVQESPHPSTAASDGVSRLSSDEGENEEKEESMEKLDCHYSAYHPRPAATCTFGSRQLARGCYGFDRRWDRLRCALSAMVDRHVNAQMWKKIPPASEMVSSTMPQRTSTNSHLVPNYSGNATGFQCPTSATPSPVLVSPSYAQSLDSKAVLSYGTTLNARVSPGGSTDPPSYNTPARPSVWPQLPSGHSAIPSPVSSKPSKPKPSNKPFRPREPSGSSATSNSGKKRRSSSPLSAHPPTATQPSSSVSSTSSTFRKNCAVTSHHLPLAPSPSSHSAGLSCTPGRTSSLGPKQEQPGRGPPSGSPAESIKRMSVVMNSSDSTLSLGPFVHQTASAHGGFPHTSPDHRLEGKRRKGSLAAGSREGGGASGPGRPLKLPKSPTMNNLHGKHGRTITGTPGLPNNTFIQPPKARP